MIRPLFDCCRASFGPSSWAWLVRSWALPCIWEHQLHSKTVQASPSISRTPWTEVWRGSKLSKSLWQPGQSHGIDGSWMLHQLVGFYVCLALTLVIIADVANELWIEREEALVSSKILQDRRTWHVFTPSIRMNVGSTSCQICTRHIKSLDVASIANIGMYAELQYLWGLRKLPSCRNLALHNIRE